jgi:hypothetical protein
MARARAYPHSARLFPAPRGARDASGRSCLQWRAESNRGSRGGDSGRHQVDPRVSWSGSFQFKMRTGWDARRRNGGVSVEGNDTQAQPAASSRAQIYSSRRAVCRRLSFDVRIALAAGTMVWLAFALCGAPIGVTLR